MSDDLLTYRDMRKILPREDIYDMVAFNILTPVEETNTSQSWKFRRSDLTDDLYKRLNYMREMCYQANVNQLLADKVEHEWKPRSKR